MDGPHGIYSIVMWVIEFSNLRIKHCYHVNDFPLVNSTPGIIQDPIDLLLAKCILTKVLVFNACNTVDLLLAKCILT